MEDHTTPSKEETTPPQQVTSNNKKWIIAAIILLLLSGLGYCLLTKNNAAQEKILSLEQASHQSDSLYNELKRELAVYKQENEELYSQIAQKESELENQYSKIKRLIIQAKRDKAAKKEIQTKLDNLSTELANMRAYVEEQTLDLEELRIEVRRLRKEKEALDAKYAAELEERKRLAQEGADLQDANNALNEKLNTASVLQVANVHASGARLKGNGERKGVHLAKKTEVVEICFDIVKNEVCESGPNRFFVRILDPDGAVVSDTNRGSGKLKLFDDEEEIGYTVSKIFTYNTDVSALCVDWFTYPTTPFKKGTYHIELYNKGRQVGKYDFVTK